MVIKETLGKVKRTIRNPKKLIYFINRLRCRRLILKKYRNNKESFFFVQIGANDGVYSDPLYDLIIKYNWGGILIEPLEEPFKKLKENYKDMNNIHFENTAISDKNEHINIYKSESTGLSSVYPNEWFAGRNKGKALKNRKKALPPQKVKVKSMTFCKLIKKYKLQRISLLQIDTEGYDFEIIKNIDFFKIDIRMIRFEKHHYNTEEMDEIITFLKDKNYNLLNLGQDLFGYK